MSGRWLTADEQQAWRACLRAGTLLTARLKRQLQADSGLALLGQTFETITAALEDVSTNALEDPEQ